MTCKKNIILCLCFLLTGFIRTAAGNLLHNSSFENNSGPSSKKFAEWETWGDNVFEAWNKESRTGQYSAKFWWSGGIYQQFSAESGNKYKITTWLCTPMSEPLALNGSKFAVVELQFLSKKNEVIFVKKSEIFNSKREIGEWYQLAVEATVPPGAGFIRAAVEFVGGEGGGVVLIDDVTLELIEKKKFSDFPFSLNLEGVWKIKKGDDLRQKDKDYDDSSWGDIEVPGNWEIKYPGYDGFAWYRFHFSIPRDIPKEQLFLLLGIIDDADETYFNGQKIGSGGSVPPYFQTAHDKRRMYDIPPDIIRYGKDNVLAVRVYDNMGAGGILRRPVRLFNASGYNLYLKDLKERGLQLARPVSSAEIKKLKSQYSTPKRLKIKKLSNTGWTFLLPDNKPFFATGVEYEPMAMYGEMNWKLIERDFNLIRDTGFNTVTVWCMDFNASQGAGTRITIEEMVRLTELAKQRGLFIQFYLNIDRFINLFPMAVLANGQPQGFDIDYYHPEYRKFIRNYARRIAFALYPYDNVSTIVIWEEKIGLNADFQEDKVIVESFYASQWGKAAFKKWLIKRHHTIQDLNKAWGTDYASFDKAIDNSLLDYLNGVNDSDHRQYDILEFGEIMLIDFAKDFVKAYKSIDPAMLFQCRNWDLFGPVRAIDPRYSFLDSFGVNNYSQGEKGPDIVLREEIIKMKLVSGIAGIAPYVSNFGFRAKTYDNATHGLVPNEKIKASLAADTTAVFSFLPEMLGTSYFTYLFKGPEGPFGIIKDANGKPLPICNSLKSLHKLISKCNKEISLSDYETKPDVYIFHGLDAIYDLRQRTWMEHSTMGWDLSELNLNYNVITDVDKFSPDQRPIIIANFHVYDKKIDSDVVRKLINYCKDGGTLVIGNIFGRYNRYLWPDPKLEKKVQEIRGIEISELKTGRVKVIVPHKKYNIPDIEINDTWYVNGDKKTLTAGAKILLEIEVDGKKQPGLICRKFGKGKVYYFLFNPYHHKEWWLEKKLTDIDRTSIPVLHFLFSEMGIKHDTDFGNRGFVLKNGRINVHEKPVHYFIYNKALGFGTYQDIYGEDKEPYSGGVITDNFVSFRGRNLKERGWDILLSDITSFYACIQGNKLSYCTSEPVKVNLIKRKWKINRKTEKYKIYDSIVK